MYILDRKRLRREESDGGPWEWAHAQIFCFHLYLFTLATFWWRGRGRNIFTGPPGKTVVWLQSGCNHHGCDDAHWVEKGEAFLVMNRNHISFLGQREC